MSNPISHGRGGAGNIDRDTNTYTDGSIVREGPLGDQGDGAYSSGVRLQSLISFISLPSYLLSFPIFPPSHTIDNQEAKLTNSTRIQRGGAGNINSPRVKAANPTNQPGDTDVVPETALRQTKPGDEYSNYHTGRGGEGNVHREKASGEESKGSGLGGKVEELKEKVLHPFGHGHSSEK